MKKLVISIMCMLLLACASYSSNPDEYQGIPVGAKILKKYESQSDFQAHAYLWMLDSMCFMSIGMQTSYSTMTYVPCPVKYTVIYVIK